MHKTSDLRCPKCQGVMSIKVIQEVEVDYCMEHGLWLDKGELNRIIQGSKKSCKEFREMQTDNARHEGKVQGFLFGAWSFLWK
jgi:Zn-finger nucleic acid-binding protein